LFDKFINLHTKYIRCGCEHERTAYYTYKDVAIKNHENFEIREAGLFVDVSIPYLGTSPDGIINCKCHGMGVLKIKCPYCFREQLPEEQTQNSRFCLEQENDQWKIMPTTTKFKCRWL